MDSETSDRDDRSTKKRSYSDDERHEPSRRRKTAREDISSSRPRTKFSDETRQRRSRSRSPRTRKHSSRVREREEEKERDGSRREERGSRQTREIREDARSPRYRDSDHGSSRRRHEHRSWHGDYRDEREPSATGETLGNGDGGNKRAVIKRDGPLPSQDDSFAISKGEEPVKPKEKPNFGNTGMLAAASNTITQADGSSVTLKYHEPPEARKPASKHLWKLFVFKGPDIIDTIELSARSSWLIGREMAVVDLAAEHPSISKQHAVIQFRYTEKRNEFGDVVGKVKPYLIDLESANGTMLNGDKIPESRYLELRHKDMIQFGLSTREYVLMLAPRD